MTPFRGAIVGFGQVAEHGHWPAFAASEAFQIVAVVERSAARRDAVMELQRELVETRLAARVGDHVRVMVDGLSPESDLVLTGRLNGQAPDIDALVYLDECDPSEWQPGQVVEAVITGARGYDLVVTPRP